ncbi:origin recognition complex subunit 4 C-terminus-domain-containing protein [Mycena belliarum]|uniref:Origin recognition complex subunit 4 C-terminus-domain-containing protein n=1 Tax=Mycena belliarum TaxID=1033014 RepID=A0AAD6UDZ2_9AGAR|nr:origin recognition complex subunit 4 C-terminus-domain-containing protein [Mycena belliae]
MYPTPESEDELTLRPSRTRSGKIRAGTRSRPRPPVGSEVDISISPPSSLINPRTRIRKNRSPSPVPDSESESPTPASPVASSSRFPSPAEYIPANLDRVPTPTAADVSTSQASITPLSQLNARKREILRSIHIPSDLVDEEEGSANHLASNQLNDILKGTVARGEGNSCLLIGPRSSGKTRIVEKCLSNISDRLIIIRLCGWSQKSDRLAMREIAYQLSQQTGNSFLTVADEEPAEEQLKAESDPFLDAPDRMPMSLPPATHLPALISLLPTLSRPTVVVLDAFDLFAQHPRQSLLYCLLDTVQSCRAGVGSKGVAVIGMTTRVDTLNLLEKRVKSRFSGRMLRTAAPFKSQGWVELARDMLCSKTKIGRVWDKTDDLQQRWEASVNTFLDDQATESIFNETFSVSKDVRVLGRLITSIALQLTQSSPFPTPNLLVSAAATQRSRPRFSALHMLPYPSLCLLLAWVHTEIAGHSVFTFEMLYEKVRDQIRASSSAPVEFNGNSIGMPRCPRPAFESLVSARIIVSAAAPAPSIAKEFAKFRAVISREDVKKAVQMRNDINLSKWLTKAS